MGICVHSTHWLQARIGMKPDAASGRCVQLRLCPTRLPRGHRKITRSNTKATSDLHSEKLRPPDHETSLYYGQSTAYRCGILKHPVLDREARVAAGEGATTLGDHWHPFSLITCIRMSCASNAGKLEVGSHSWRSLFVPACPATDFHFEKGCTGIRFFISTSPRSLGNLNTVAGWCHWSQTRFGHARGERSRPHFKAHNSVRPLKNGLSLGGSSDQAHLS